VEHDNADVLYLLGSLYLEIDEEKKAIELLRQSIAFEPEHDGSLNSLAYIYAEKGTNLEEAMDLVTHALEIDPDNGAYLDTLGWIYCQENKYEKALEILKRADQYLKDPVIYEHIGDVYYKLNHVEDAIHYWELSLELLPDQERVILKLEEVKNTQASVIEKDQVLTTK
jgi:Tfp pilus assembly protein PilF